MSCSEKTCNGEQVMITMICVTDWKSAARKAARMARWAVTMTKVRIRRVIARTRWQLVTFDGKHGGESVGVIDMIAIRKDHRNPRPETKRGGALQIVLTQVKGGSAAIPTGEDGTRLAAVAKRLHGRHILLACWKKGTAAQFFRYRPRAKPGPRQWSELADLDSIFR